MTQDPKLNSHSKLNCILACIAAEKAGADDPRLAFVKLQCVGALAHLARCADARDALLALRATAVLHRLLSVDRLERGWVV